MKRLQFLAVAGWVGVSLMFAVTSSIPTTGNDKHHYRVDPEIFMDPTELITSKGYPCENHYIITQDGFILNMQRIPHGRQRQKITGPQPVVILQHGLIGSSYNWLDNLANESLSYLLADRGADVWLGNIRGNTFSRNHTTLKPEQEQFWDWTYDEMAALDLPAMFDHVRHTTGQEQVHYVGHSQGTMIGFAAFSTNLTLAAMVKRFYALAPVANVGNIKSPIKALAPYSSDLSKFVDMIGHGEFDKYNRAWRRFVSRDVCQKLGQVLCEDDLFVIGGADKIAMNISRVPVYMAHSPGGTSVKNIMHFAQGVNYKKFQMFDYGSAEANQAKYGRPTPPPYLPENVKVPIVAYSAGQDILADPADVAWLLQRIKSSLVASHYIPFWDHLDFIFGFDAPKYCYNDIIKWIFQ
ncbi:gastric triacylglycerol lipase-like [Littorina saxatilis]|uniref:Lipase n=1 Tax=Littorina saxatilis TaxID=31220 RepID=A0AAN9BXB5_9CAEN